MEKGKSKVAVVGGKGNMGRRYIAILRLLNVEHYVIDIGTDRQIDPKTTGIIISTPTETHYNMLKEFGAYNIPILIEKPICKDLNQLEDILDFTKTNLRMINQYEYWFKDKPEVKIRAWLGEAGKGNKKYSTYYNYYHSGVDGMLWDCINIIGLDSSEKITLGQNLPTWECWINGEKIPREEMDDAYIWNIDDWLEKLDDNRKYILMAHRKVGALEERYKTCKI